MQAMNVEQRGVYGTIFVFFVLSCALTWFGLLGNVLLESKWWPVPMFPLGPVIAAPIVLLVTEGSAGLGLWWKRIRRFRAPAGVYLAATVVPTIIVVGAAGLAVAVGADIDTSPWTTLPEVLLVLPLTALLFGPVPEETSFRGYGQHELQKVVSPYVTALAIGFGVLVWHLPVLLSGDIPWTVAIALPAVSIVYAWLYQAGGSIWPLVALHAIQNSIGGQYIGQMFEGRDDVIWIGFLAAAYVTWAVVLFVRLGPSLRRVERAATSADGARIMPSDAVPAAR